MGRAEITQEQVEREKLFERTAERIETLEIASKLFGSDDVLERLADLRELLRLGRLATPELVALGEAAIPFGQAHATALAEGYDSQWQEVERTRHALCEAARAYAQSIKGEDHGK